MIDLEGYKVVELSAKFESTVFRLDTSVDEGAPDVYNLPWYLEDQVNPEDSSIEQLVGHQAGDPVWPIPHSGHHGSHIQLGVGHNDNWAGLPDGMLGLWEMPINTYYGEAAVCYFDDLKGQPILPEHLGNVQEGDIVLMGSPHAEDSPWIDGDTAYWLAEEKKIKMLAVGVPGIGWETKMQEPEPDNCPTHRAMTGNNIPIAYPLANIESLTKDRVFFMSMPLNVEQMEGTWIRAIAIEEI
jgi:kynurenine formamidase